MDQEAPEQAPQESETAPATQDAPVTSSEAAPAAAAEAPATDGPANDGPVGGDMMARAGALFNGLFDHGTDAAADAGDNAMNAMTNATGAAGAAASERKVGPSFLDRAQDWLHDKTGLVDESQTTQDLHAGMDQADGILKSRFKIDNDSPSGNGTVTQADYDKMKADMGKVIAGQGYLNVDTGKMNEKDAAEYKSKLYDDMARISQTSSGRELLDGLVNQNGVDDPDKRHTTTLTPNLDKDGKPLPQGEADPTPGAGQARDSTVRFNPGQDLTPEGIAQGSKDGKTPTDDWLPMRSDVVLYHELVHAKEQTAGKDIATPVQLVDFDADHMKGATDSGRGVSEGEHQAVGLGQHDGDATTENRYRNERKDIGEHNTALAVPGDAEMKQRTSYLYHTN